MQGVQGIQAAQGTQAAQGVQGATGGGGGGGLGSRATVATTTATLAYQASANATVTAAKGYALYTIQVTAGAWVVVYTSSSTRSADASRNIGTDPTPGSGVISEIITTVSGTIYFSPAVVGYNADVPVGTSMYLKIYNNSGSSAAITATMTYVAIEA